MGKIILTEVDLSTGLTHLYNRDITSRDELTEFWDKHNMSSVHSSSTSNLGYEDESCPTYSLIQGVKHNTCIAVSWIYIEED